MPKWIVPMSWWVWFGLVVLFIVAPLNAAPMAEAHGGGVRVVLTDEPCAVAAVTNLPKRATWEEKGKTIEGCYTVSDGLVVSYWADRTVSVIPAQVFVRVIES